MAASANVLRPRTPNVDVDRLVADIGSVLRASGDHSRCIQALTAYDPLRFGEPLKDASPHKESAFVRKFEQDGWDEV